MVDFKRLSIAYRYDLHVTRRVIAAGQKRTVVDFERAFLVNPEKLLYPSGQMNRSDIIHAERFSQLTQKDAEANRYRGLEVRPLQTAPVALVIDGGGSQNNIDTAFLEHFKITKKWEGEV